MARSGPEQASFPWVAMPRTAAEPQKVPRSAATLRPETRAQVAEARLWLTADEATVFLGFPSRKALYTAVERGQVPASGLGRRLRFHRDGLHRLLLQKRSGGDRIAMRVPSPGKETERW
jgi:hypothetical protein